MIKAVTKVEMALLIFKPVSLSGKSGFLTETDQIAHKRLPTASG